MHDQPSQTDRRRPMLLVLVFGLVLVLVGITAGALVAVASAHFSSATLTGVVERDASLIEAFVNANLRQSDLDPDGPTAVRARELSELLGLLTNADDGSIVRLEIRDPLGRILASDDAEALGAEAGLSPRMREALETAATADLIDAGSATDAVGSLPNQHGMVREYLPIVDAEGGRLAVVAVWRDAAHLMDRLKATQRDVMLVTLVAGLLLAAMLFLIFRATQARLTQQHRQLIESTRRDALTGLLNHGAVVALLADRLEEARGRDDGIGIALLDVDNFRLFNDTYGHDAADEVLHRVARLVQRHEGLDYVARYGPDEFLIGRGGADAATMRDAVDRLRTELRDEAVRFGDSEALPITVSAGIAAYPDHASSVTDLLSAAVVAVNEARASGGDGVRVAQDSEEERGASRGFDVLQGLVIAVDTKDRYTKRHSEDVARYAVFLARQVGLDEEELRTIELAGLLHDIGKIGIPDTVLRKPSRLTAEEFAAFQQHVALGDAIVRDVPNVDVVRAGIRHHHERWDGGGYLDGLAGEEIPHIARILAVADAFSAMTTTRPYRKALPIEEALKRLEDAAGSQLEEDLVSVFVRGIETLPDAPMPGEPTAPTLWVPRRSAA